MRARSVIGLLVVASVQLWPAHAHAADSNAIGRAYTLQATEVARRVVLAELVKHPERIHRMTMKCTIPARPTRPSPQREGCLEHP